MQMYTLSVLVYLIFNSLRNLQLKGTDYVFITLRG